MSQHPPNPSRGAGSTRFLTDRRSLGSRVKGRHRLALDDFYGFASSTPDSSPFRSSSRSFRRTVTPPWPVHSSGRKQRRHGCMPSIAGPPRSGKSGARSARTAKSGRHRSTTTPSGASTSGSTGTWPASGRPRPASALAGSNRTSTPTWTGSRPGRTHRTGCSRCAGNATRTTRLGSPSTWRSLRTLRRHSCFPSGPEPCGPTVTDDLSSRTSVISARALSPSHCGWNPDQGTEPMPIHPAVACTFHLIKGVASVQESVEDPAPADRR